MTAFSDPGFIPQSKRVESSPGVVVAGMDFELQPLGTPIPEYPLLALPALLIITMLAATVMIRRHLPAGAGRGDAEVLRQTRPDHE